MYVILDRVLKIESDLFLLREANNKRMPPNHCRGVMRQRFHQNLYYCTKMSGLQFLHPKKQHFSFE